MNMTIYLIMVAMFSSGACVVGIRMHAKRLGKSQPTIHSLKWHMLVCTLLGCTFSAVLSHVVVSGEMREIVMRTVEEKRDLSPDEIQRVHDLSKWWIGPTL